MQANTVYVNVKRLQGNQLFSAGVHFLVLAPNLVAYVATNGNAVLR